MPFTFTNPVAVGDYVLKSQYDVTWDNVDFLHDDVLRIDSGTGDVVIGLTSRVNIKQIGRTTQAETVDILAGTNTAEDARLVLYGNGSGIAASMSFVQRLSGDPFVFFTADTTDILLRIDGSSTQGIIDRALDTGSLMLRGGPDGNDSRFILTGQNSASAYSTYTQARADDAPFLWEDAAAVTVVKIDPAVGNTYFYNPGGVTSYVFIEADATPAISLNQSSAIVSLWKGDAIEFHNGDSASYVRGDGNIEVVADYEAADGGPYAWVFSGGAVTGGTLTLPDTTNASTTGGTIWYDSSQAAGERLRIYIDGSEKFINVT